MTFKQFVKSTAFKCIVTLLCVLLISGVFLTLMHALLEVTEEDKFNRKVGNLYGDGAAVTTQEQTLEPTKIGTSTVEKLWLVPEKNDYLVQISGAGRDGKLVVWVIVNTEQKKVTGVGTVLVYEKVASEYADKIPGWNSNITNFSADYKDGIVYKYGTKGDEMYINTGASVSFTAICNCVNDAIKFVGAYASGGSISESPLDKFLFNELINKDETTVSFADGKLTYNIKTTTYGATESPFSIKAVVGADKKIESFEILENGSTPGFETGMPDVENIFKGKDLSYFTALYGETMEYKGMSYEGTDITTGASTGSSYSTYVCMYAGAFATANFDNALKLGFNYTEVIDTENTTYSVADGKVTYNIKTTTYGATESPFSIKAVVGTDKKIESFEILENGSTPGFETGMPDVENIFKGKDLSYFTALYGETMEYKGMSYEGTDITTGASTGSSYSTYVCMYAGAFATANYDLVSIIGGSANE